MNNNANDNHSDVATDSRKRHSSTKEKLQRAKQVKSRHDSSEDDINDLERSEKFDTIRFEEDDSLVELGVADQGRSEFPSENEASSDESETEEGEVSDQDAEEQEQQQDEDEEQASQDEQLRTTPPSERRVIKRSRPSVEDKVDELSSTVRAMQEMMKEKGILEEFQHSIKSKKKKKNKKQNSHAGESEDENSDTTIYQEAMKGDNNFNEDADPEVSFKPPSQRRISSSDEDQIDTSDELLDVDNFIADCEQNTKRLSGQNMRNEDRLNKQCYTQGDQDI